MGGSDCKLSKHCVFNANVSYRSFITHLFRLKFHENSCLLSVADAAFLLKF